ncbi:hypothetical protein JTE90_015314 [Oedothorax gibbosus]|uniref:Transposase n=1 Tax=Oedothorax gibbosus TaxID=931172 RepID=A0AAV6VQ76_9ARAC|nr:hypothetical protein JTE90_015314 [Oedothorax gibbosus]
MAKTMKGPFGRTVSSVTRRLHPKRWEWRQRVAASRGEGQGTVIRTDDDFKRINSVLLWEDEISRSFRNEGHSQVQVDSRHVSCPIEW